MPIRSIPRRPLESSSRRLNYRPMHPRREQQPRLARTALERVAGNVVWILSSVRETTRRLVCLSFRRGELLPYYGRSERLTSLSDRSWEYSLNRSACHHRRLLKRTSAQLSSPAHQHRARAIMGWGLQLPHLQLPLDYLRSYRVGDGTAPISSDPRFHHQHRGKA